MEKYRSRLPEQKEDHDGRGADEDNKNRTHPKISHRIPARFLGTMKVERFRQFSNWCCRMHSNVAPYCRPDPWSCFGCRRRREFEITQTGSRKNHPE